VGTLLKLVRHDWLKPLVVNGNLGQTVVKPKIHVGLVRPVALVQSTQIALQGDNGLSYLPWPTSKNIRETAKGFEIDLVGFGEFKYVMEYEIVAPKLTHDSTICPHCQANLVGDPIPEEHREDFGGATHFQRQIGIERDHDRIEAYQCPDCKTIDEL
jgi:hypothetical protein